MENKEAPEFFEIKEDEEDVEQELESDGGDPSLMEVDPEEEAEVKVEVEVKVFSEDDPRDGTTAEERMELLFNQDIGTRKDVIFFVGEEKVVIKGHRHFLASKSEVFKYTFFESAKYRAKPGEVVHYELPTLSPAVFRTMLKFIYTKRVDWNNLVDPVLEGMAVLKVAQQFKVQSLIDLCVAQVKSHFTPENVLGILDVALKLISKELVVYSMDFILANAGRTLRGQDFYKLRPEQFAMMLINDDLNLPEFGVFECVMRWGKERIRARRNANGDTEPIRILGSDIRKEIGPLLSRIRFPLMTKYELEDVQLEYKGLLDVQDISKIYQFSQLGSDPAPFCSRRRTPIQGRR